MSRRRRRLAGLLVGGISGLWFVAAAPAETRRVGIFFDEGATTCVGQLEPFGRIQAHVYAFAEPGLEFAGAILRLQLPPDISIIADTIEWPRNTDPIGDLTATSGLDLQFQICPIVQGPLLLVSFELTDLSFGEVRPNLDLAVRGGAVLADTLDLVEPHLKTCDPGNPNSYLELLPAVGLRATLNCTGNCPCEPVAVKPLSWALVKRLFLGD